MRGEDLYSAQNMTDGTGSPPHARGRHSMRTQGFPATGITPACAGKTSRVNTALESIADHPRMRGEDVAEPKYPFPVIGSPPHARGRRQSMARRNAERRITPACAGKTLWNYSDFAANADHPRMRGEDL